MSGAGHIDPSNKKVALMIAVLALVLAFSETLGNGSQTKALSENIEASNLWAFFQAKTIRRTTVQTASESAALELPNAQGPAKEAIEKQMASWKAAAERYESEPATNEGRKELMVRAKAAETKRDTALAAYHHYEVASAAVQIAIVLASAEIVTGVAFLSGIAGLLGIVGVAFCVIGFWFPMAVHLF